MWYEIKDNQQVYLFVMRSTVDHFFSGRPQLFSGRQKTRNIQISPPMYYLLFKKTFVKTFVLRTIPTNLQHSLSKWFLQVGCRYQPDSWWVRCSLHRRSIFVQPDTENMYRP